MNLLSDWGMPTPFHSENPLVAIKFPLHESGLHLASLLHNLQYSGSIQRPCACQASVLPLCSVPPRSFEVESHSVAQAGY